MEYTIKKVAQLSGVSTRTLRYYDELGLLVPARINSSGYRIYGQKEVDRLQQILFYRRLDLKLEAIKKILEQPDFDYQQALEAHYQQLLDKRMQIDLLLTTIQQTLRYHKGEIQMTDSQKFAAFKQQKLAENEAQYGSEIREKYGETAVADANKKWGSMSEADFNLMQQTESQLFTELIQLTKSRDLTAQTAKNVYELHKKWLSYSLPHYTMELHKNLTDMYLADERFARYYNEKTVPDATQWLRDAVHYYAQ